MPKLCLNSIVKNEGARILRMLESVAPHISCFVIVDTGSTDNTVELITEFFKARNIPGMIGKTEFKNFSQARNAALLAMHKSPYPFDYALLVDADMVLRVKDPTWVDDLTGDSYDIFQTSGTVVYQNRRLVRKGCNGLYVGVTHEYLDVATTGCLPMDKVDFLDYADGANRTKKYKRDIKLLKEGLKDEPKNERYMYYLAQSYRDAGEHEKSAKWYKRRVEAGGWDEEVWSAQYCYATCLKSMGDEAGFIREMLVAYNMRPSRAEALFDLANHYRVKGQNPAAALFSEVGMDIPYSKDALFVNDYVYKSGLKEEFSIAAFYVPEKRAKGFDVSNELSLSKTAYAQSRELARVNLFYYYGMLSEVCPSFKSQVLALPEQPADYSPMNPSICLHRGALWGIVRTVNYRIDEHGRYLIRASDGTANDSNPIHTRNFLVKLNDDLHVETSVELLPPSNMPTPLFKAVIGFEDMRIFSWKNDLWASACLREMTPEGWCEQVAVRIGHDDITFQPDQLNQFRRLQHEPRVHEKNWMPIVKAATAEPLWMYRCNEITAGHPHGFGVIHDVPWDIGGLGGGSQVIPYMSGWLAVVHEARLIPGQPRRYYSHRFVWWDSNFVLRRISKQFGLHEKVIEYVMGLAWHPVDPKLLVMSYGFKDSEARIATVDASEVMGFLWQE